MKTKYGLFALLMAAALSAAAPPALTRDDFGASPRSGRTPASRRDFSAIGRSYRPRLPAGSVEYAGGGNARTQAISVHNSEDTIELVKTLDPEWLVSGGMLGLKGWKSRKWRLLPSPPQYRLADVEVENSLKEKQPNRALLRTYPDGTRFDDVLTNALTGVVFEHRVREKRDGKWVSRVEYEAVAARPAGYSGLSRSCSSCHSQTATGKYAEGLVPGGDTVFSDPVDFEQLKKHPSVRVYAPWPNKIQ